MIKGLGLDFGKSRVGLAVGTLVASELITIKISPWEKFIEKLSHIVKEESIDYIVIGVPMSRMNSESTNFILNKTKILQDYFDIPIYKVDETLTTKRAEELLKEEGADPLKIKLRSDQMAAKLILQQYLDENN